MSTYRQTIQTSKRKAIVDSAIAIFLDGGFENAGMARIASEADVSTATLYKHFESKEALFIAITDQIAQEVNPTMPGDELNAMAFEPGLVHVGCLIAEMLNNPRVIALYRLVVAEAHKFPELRDLVHGSGLEPYRNSLIEFIEQKVKAKEVTLDTASVRYVIEQYFGMLFFLLLYSRMLDVTRVITLEQARAAVVECAKTITARFGNDAKQNSKS